MVIKMSVFWTVALNVVGWLVLQVGLAYLFLRMPTSWFDFCAGPKKLPNKFLFESVFRIKSWKGQLPDGAGWFPGGFMKASLAKKSSVYLQRFVQETRRGEICHWMVIACAPIFLIWNPWGGFLLNLAYVLLANLPCILVQRYTRARLLHLLVRLGSGAARLYS